MSPRRHLWNTHPDPNNFADTNTCANSNSNPGGYTYTGGNSDPNASRNSNANTCRNAKSNARGGAGHQPLDPDASPDR